MDYKSEPAPSRPAHMGILQSGLHQCMMLQCGIMRCGVLQNPGYGFGIRPALIGFVHIGILQCGIRQCGILQCRFLQCRILKGPSYVFGIRSRTCFSIEPYDMISPKHQKQNAKQAQQTNHNKWHIAKWLERRTADLVQCQVRRRLDCSQPNHHVACATWSFEVAAYVSSCLFIIALPGLADRNLASPTLNTGAPRALTKSIFRLVSEKHRGSCCSVITPGSLAEAAGFYFCWVYHR